MRFPSKLRATNRMAVVAASVLVIVAVSLLASTLYANRGRYGDTDFALYYRWAEQLRQGIDPWLPASSASGAAAHTYCNYTPPFVETFAPLTWLRRPVAYALWQAIQAASLFGAVLLVAGELRPPPRGAGLVSLLALTFMFPHVYATLYEAQPNAMLLLLVMASWRWSRRGSPALSGIALATATLLKLYPAAVGGYFMFRRRWRELGWAAGATILGAIATGPARWLEFFAYGAPVFTQIPLLKQERQIAISSNFYAMFAHLLGDTTGAVILTMALTAVADLTVVTAAALATMRADDDTFRDGMSLSLWIVAALLLSPLSWSHELVWLVPLFVLVLAAIARRIRLPDGALILLAIGLSAMIVPYFWTPLRRLHLYFIATAVSYLAAWLIASSWNALRAATVPHSPR